VNSDDPDFEPFAKLPRTSDINGFVISLLASLNEITMDSSNCRS
jgi:hypothetical protein